MNKRETRIILPCGRVIVRAWSGPVRPSLGWLQGAVGGYIEPVDARVPQPDDGTEIRAYAHEEGRIHGLAQNTLASALLLWPGLVGPVVVISGWTREELEALDPVTPDDLGTVYLKGRGPA